MSEAEIENALQWAFADENNEYANFFSLSCKFSYLFLREEKKHALVSSIFEQFKSSEVCSPHF